MEDQLEKNETYKTSSELRTNLPRSKPLVRYCHFGVPPVNYSDSDSERPTDRVISRRSSET